MDLQQAVRALIATPVVTTVAVLSLALGIGANTAIFSLIESLLLRPLPVRDPAQLVLIADGDATRTAFSNPVWEAIRDRAVFDGAFAWGPAVINLAKGGEAQLVEAISASGSTFETLGVSTILGRTFDARDDARGGGPDGPVTVINYSFWQRHFGGATDAVGRALVLNGVPFTIVGVTPPGFFGLDVGRSFDIAIPIGTARLLNGREQPSIDDRAYRWLRIMARLAPGQSFDEATAALGAVQPQIREQTRPETIAAIDGAQYLEAPMMLVPSSTGVSRLRSRYERPLLTMLFVVALVLAIACANVANLLLARATARRHEWSVRLALGASRWRLARQLLTESALLAALSAVLGVAIAQWASRLLVHALSTGTNRVFLDLSIDGRVLLFTIAVTIITALLFGTVPALRAAYSPPIDAIKEHRRGATGSERFSIANGLVVGQVALSVILVVAAGLFVRTFVSLTNRDLGFEHDRTLQVEVNTQQTAIDVRDRLGIYAQLRDHVLTVPGVATAAASFEAPLRSGSWEPRVEVPGGAALPDSLQRSLFNGVTAGWFDTYGIPILAGRDISDSDRRNAPPVIVVNEAFARRFFNGANPLGHTVIVRFGGARMSPRDIVGLVGDTIHNSARDQAQPEVYIPLVQFEGPGGFVPHTVNISVRAANGSPALLSRSVGAAIADVHRDVALTYRPVADALHASLTQDRVIATLAGVFGVLALLLAGLGLYGVTSYAVTRRRPEIGVRMALGATPHAVASLVLARVAGLVGLGVIIGAGLSLWATQFVTSLLFSLEPHDPVTLVGAVLVLSCVGLLAGWLPARRASRLDPVRALREG